MYAPDMRRRPRLGEILIERGTLSALQLQQALVRQRAQGGRLGDILVDAGWVEEEELLRALGEGLRLPIVRLSKVEVDRKALEMVPADFAARHRVLPFRRRETRGRVALSVAMDDPLNVRLVDEISFMTHASVEPVLATGSDIDLAIGTHYGRGLIAPRVSGDEPVRVRSDSSTTMTILRPGGVEETVRSRTGSVLATRAPDGSAVPRTPPPRDDSLILTDEVSESSREMVAMAARLSEMERRFWALMRIMVRKELISRDEFLEELGTQEVWRRTGLDDPSRG